MAKGVTLTKFDETVNRTRKMALVMLGNAYQNTKGSLVAYKVLQSVHIGDVIPIGTGVVATKLKQSDRHCMFRVNFKHNGCIGKQEHDCIEMIILRSGLLIDRANDNEVIDPENPIYIIPPYTTHQIEAFGMAATADILFKNPAVSDDDC